MMTNKKLNLNVDIIIFILTYLLIVVNVCYKMPMLDDIAFFNTITSKGIIGSILEFWRFEGRMISPFALFHYLLILVLKSNKLILLFYVSIFFVFFLHKFKKYLIPISVGLLIFINEVRGVSYETLFWQSGIIYLSQFLFFLLIVNEYNIYSRKRWYLLLIGFCTYQISIAAVFLIFVRDFCEWRKSRNLMDYLRANIFKYLYVVTPICIMVFLSPNERLIKSNVHITTDPREFWSNLYVGIWEFKQDWMEAVFSVLIFSLYFLGIDKYKCLNKKDVLNYILIIFLGFVTFLPNVLLHQFQQRNSLYFGLLFCVGLFLLLNYFWYVVLNNNLTLIVDHKVKNYVVLSVFLLYYSVKSIRFTRENSQFHQVYNNRLLDFSNQVKKVEVLYLHDYSEGEMKKYFGYSDEYMLSRRWVQEIYKEKFGIQSFVRVKDSLIIKYIK